MEKLSFEIVDSDEVEAPTLLHKVFGPSIPDCPVFDTTAGERDWCKTCGADSDTIFLGYGYCKAHLAKAMGYEPEEDPDVTYFEL